MIRAKRWSYLCGRKGFTAKSITPNTFICTKHFPCNTNISKTDKEFEPHNAAGTDVRNKRKSPVKRKVYSPATAGAGPASAASAPASSDAASASAATEPDDEVNPRQIKTYRKKPRLARDSDTESCGSDTDTASTDSWDAMVLHRFVKIKSVICDPLKMFCCSFSSSSFEEAYVESAPEEDGDEDDDEDDDKDDLAKGDDDDEDDKAKGDDDDDDYNSEDSIIICNVTVEQNTSLSSSLLLPCDDQVYETKEKGVQVSLGDNLEMKALR
jgi:hypothetical protein